MKIEPRTLWKAIVEEATHTREGGSLPSSWRWVRLGDIVELNPRNHLPDDMSVSFLTMEQIGAGLEGNYTPSVRNWGEVRKNFTHFKDGDVILAKITPCFQNRKSALVSGLTNGYGAGTTELHVLRAKECVLNRYIYYLVKSEYFIFMGANNMQGTAGQKRIRTPFIKNVLIPLPPIDEQREIVARLEPLLREVEELDEHYQRYKHAKEVFRKSAIQDAVHVKDEELPAGWRWVSLGDVVDVISGQSPEGRSINKSEGVEFHQGKIAFSRKYILPSEFYTTAPKKIAPAGSVLLSVRAPVGNVNVTDRDICVGRGLAFFRCKDEMNNDYLYYLMSSLEQTFRAKGRGTTFDGITAKMIRSQPIPLPPIDEQLHIVNHLDNITHQLDIMP